MFKSIIFFVIFCTAMRFANAQDHDDCATKVTQFIPIDKEQLRQSQLLYTTPYQLKLFIHICADDNGSNVSMTTKAAFDTYIQGTRDYYAPHNICFSLVGVDTIYSTALNDMIVDNTSDYDLIVSKLVPGVVNVFFHRSISDKDGGGYNGNAYNIPNYFCSVLGSLVGSSNETTLAHEMGHDLGLYHTFERANKKRETVPRSGSESNCTIAGDLLCDTEADPQSGSYNLGDFVNASCVYTGTAKDSLGYFYDPPVRNIMTYGRFSCRDEFTQDQKDRMTYFITNNATLEGTLNEETLTVTASGTANSGTVIRAARNTVTIAPTASTSPNYVVGGSCRARYTAKDFIDFKPGVQFAPSSNAGLADAHINVMCQ
jgi:hypothetical protein